MVASLHRECRAYPLEISYPAKIFPSGSVPVHLPPPGRATIVLLWHQPSNSNAASPAPLRGSRERMGECLDDTVSDFSTPQMPLRARTLWRVPPPPLAARVRDTSASHLFFHRMRAVPTFSPGFIPPFLSAFLWAPFSPIHFQNAAFFFRDLLAS